MASATEISEVTTEVRVPEKIEDRVSVAASADICERLNDDTVPCSTGDQVVQLKNSAENLTSDTQPTNLNQDTAQPKKSSNKAEQPISAPEPTNEEKEQAPSSSQEPPKPDRPAKLPDLPPDLGPLKARCTTMSQRVLGLLKEKVTEDLEKCRETNDRARCQQLRELLWKVTDCERLGQAKVKELESKTSYEIAREREEKRYGKRREKKNQDKRNKKRRGKRGFDIRDARMFARGFVVRVIDGAVNRILAEDAEERKKKQLGLVKGLVDSVIDYSISRLLLERQHNLSSVEADLLLAIQEDEEEEGEMKTVQLNESIKIEPMLI